MESNFGSSESNFGYGYGYNRHSKIYSPESNYASESRDSYIASPSFSTQSTLDSIPSSIFSSKSNKTDFGSEIRETTTPSYGGSSGSKKPYNSLEDVDRLIERLETSLQNTQVTSERVNQILEQRKQKIESLKQLVAKARKAEAEEKMIKQLEQENSELDEAIDSISRGLHR